MDETYIKTNNWIRPTISLPKSGTRCLVTDGNIIIIATYIAESDDKCVWIFSELTIEDSKTFEVEGWMELPKPIKKLIVYEENKIDS